MRVSDKRLVLCFNDIFQIFQLGVPELFEIAQPVEDGFQPFGVQLIDPFAPAGVM